MHSNAQVKVVGRPLVARTNYVSISDLCIKELDKGKMSIAHSDRGHI